MDSGDCGERWRDMDIPPPTVSTILPCSATVITVLLPLLIQPASGVPHLSAPWGGERKREILYSIIMARRNKYCTCTGVVLFLDLVAKRNMGMSSSLSQRSFGQVTDLPGFFPQDPHGVHIVLFDICGCVQCSICLLSSQDDLWHWGLRHRCCGEGCCTAIWLYIWLRSLVTHWQSKHDSHQNSTSLLSTLPNSNR